MSKIVIFPGTFDPFTIGHASIVERALRLFDRVIIAVGYNIHKPTAAESAEKRAAAIKKVFRRNDSVEVKTYSGLTADFVKKEKGAAIIRGVRNIADFEYEKTLADVNMEIAGVETIFLLPDSSLGFISSSMVRELRENGYDISRFLPSAD